MSFVKTAHIVQVNPRSPLSKMNNTHCFFTQNMYLSSPMLYSTVVSDVDDKYMDFCCFYHQKAIFRHFLETSEKLVPILCHRGQKFSVSYKHQVFLAHAVVRYDGFWHHIKYAKQALFNDATSIRFVDQTRIGKCFFILYLIFFYNFEYTPHSISDATWFFGDACVGPPGGIQPERVRRWRALSY